MRPAAPLAAPLAASVVARVVALVVALVVLAACRTNHPLRIGSSDDDEAVVDAAAPPPTRVATVAVAVLVEGAASHRPLDVPFRVIDVGDAAAVLLAPDLAERLDAAAPADWPPAAVEAWTKGSAACRARAARGPWMQSEIAQRCAWWMGRAVLDVLAAARGAALVVVADDRPQGLREGWRVQAFAPRGRTRRTGEAPAGKLDDALVDAWDGTFDDEPRQRPRIPRPPAVDDPLLTADAMRTFDALSVSGCVRPLPSSLVVAPERARIGVMVARAWETMPASTRSGPPTTCTLRAFRMPAIDEAKLPPAWAATIDCEGLPLGDVVLPATGARSPGGDLAPIAVDVAAELTHTLAFDACRLTYR